MSQKLFCANTMIQWYSLKKQIQHSHPHSNLLKEGSCLHQQSHLPCQSTTPSSCSYSYLVSSMSFFCVPIDCRFTFDLVTLETVLCKRPLFPHMLQLSLNSVTIKLTSSSPLWICLSRDSKSVHHCLNEVCACNVTTWWSHYRRRPHSGN